ncbi:MAG: septum formation initiator family protein [Steroidobacteraceae bacterium]
MKWFAAALVAALLLLQYRIWFSGAGVGEVFRLRSAVTAQEADNQLLSERNRQLAAEVRDLKQGYAALEERARTDLGMIGRNETFFQVASGSALPAAAPPDGGPAQLAPIAPAESDGPATQTAAR